MIPKTTPILTDIVTAVESSFISEIVYNVEHNEMIVRFHSGSKYTYLNVSRESHDEIVNADSVGKALNTFKAGL